MARIIRGPSVTIEDQFYPAPPLIEEIQIAIEEDPDFAKSNEDLIGLYADSSDPERQLIDDTLRALCGYSMKKLLIQSDADDELMVAMGIDPSVEPEED